MRPTRWKPPAGSHASWGADRSSEQHSAPALVNREVSEPGWTYLESQWRLIMGCFQSIKGYFELFRYRNCSCELPSIVMMEGP